MILLITMVNEIIHWGFGYFSKYMEQNEVTIITNTITSALNEVTNQIYKLFNKF